MLPSALRFGSLNFVLSLTCWLYRGLNSGDTVIIALHFSAVCVLPTMNVIVVLHSPRGWFYLLS